MKKINITFGVLLLTLMSLVSFAQTSNYKIVNKISVEGNGGWDYLTFDEVSNRLFISHGTIVQVVDVKTKKLTATIPDTKGVHGIAIANDLNKGFISNGKDTSVTVFDLKTLKTLTKIKVTGLNPDAILFDKFSHKVFTFNGKTHNATVIDAKTNQVVATIDFNGKPEFSVTDGNGKIFVNIEDKNSIVEINSLTLKVENEWSIAPGEEPSGLAIDITTHRLFSVCGNKMMMIVNAENGKIITTLPIGDHCDGVAFDAGLNCIYSSNGDGTITVVKEENANSFIGLGTITTQKGTRTITLDKKTHHLYLSTSEFEAAPVATPENPRPRPKIKDGSFVILEIAPVN